MSWFHPHTVEHLTCYDLCRAIIGVVVLCSDGNAPPPGVAETIRKTCEDAKALVSKAMFAAGMALTAGALQERLGNIRGAVTMAFPMGLPEWDAVRLLLEDKDDGFLQEILGNEYMDPNTATLWWAGKEFFRDQTIGDRYVDD